MRSAGKCATQGKVLDIICDIADLDFVMFVHTAITTQYKENTGELKLAAATEALNPYISDVRHLNRLTYNDIIKSA